MPTRDPFVLRAERETLNLKPVTGLVAFNDYIDANTDSNGHQTLNTGDVVDGGGGDDYLFFQPGANQPPAAPTLISIETMEVRAGGLDLVNSPQSGLKHLVAGGDTGGSFTLTNAPRLESITLKGAHFPGLHIATNPAEVAGHEDAVTLQLEAPGAPAEFASATPIDLPGYETVNISGIGDAWISLSAGERIDASALQGRLDLTATSSAGVTIIGSDSRDTLTGGDGNDIIQASSGSHKLIHLADVLAGGKGADVFRFESATPYETLELSGGTGAPDTAVHIIDFEAGVDKIALCWTGSAGSKVTAVLAATQTMATAGDLGDIYSALNQPESRVAPSLDHASAKIVQVQAGAAAGTWLFINDQFSQASAATDLLINLTGIKGQFTAGDLIFS